MNQKKIILCFVLLMVSAFPCIVAGEETLGRLFFTPEQRIQLEQLKNKPKGETEIIISDKILVNGIVQRHGGSRVVWINGVPQGQKGSNGISIESDIAPDSVPIKILGAGSSIRLKVGQSIDLDSSALWGVSSEQELTSSQQSAQKTGKKFIPPNVEEWIK